MNTRRLLSVGIDVGTTTTQLIFSALEVTNRAPVNQVPRYEFTRREIIHQSPVIFTPFTAERSVDVAALLAFIDAQYAAAKMSRGQIESGAIIITGESSKTRNARATIMEVSDQLGDFVVATAGPHLEAIISARGSGAAEYSRANAAQVLNIDIGGGTSNYAVFAGGRAIDSACLNVGGHLIETDENGMVSRVHEPARLICHELFGPQDPQRLTLAQLDAVAARMAGLVVEVIAGTLSPLAQSLMMTSALREAYAFDAVFISGGVGACLYHPEAVASSFAYRDIGPLLAQSLKPLLDPRTLVEPAQTVRATVIGAGAHTLSLSGSTIWVSTASLPIKNLPVAHPAILDVAGLGDAWAQAVRRLDLDPARDAYALALPEAIEPLYRNIVAIAAELLSFCRQSAAANAHPLLVICAQDLGKALGMELQPQLGNRELAVIDEVQTREGDYLDIGLPIFSGSLLPVTIKSLAFPS
ncbi:MAG: eutA [Proteobacteria bacterium]|nr:eutA [Pseudomonadota bacterium]